MGTCTFTEASFPIPPFLLSARRRSGGKMKILLGEIVGSASYAAGGDNIRPGDLKGLSEIHRIWFFEGGWAKDASKYAIAAGTPGAEKLKVFSAFNTEETATTNLTTKSWKVAIMGVG